MHGLMSGDWKRGYGLGTAAPATLCVDSAGPLDYRASPRLCRPQATTAKKLVEGLLLVGLVE